MDRMVTVPREIGLKGYAVEAKADFDAAMDRVWFEFDVPDMDVFQGKAIRWCEARLGVDRGSPINVELEVLTCAASQHQPKGIPA